MSYVRGAVQLVEMGGRRQDSLAGFSSSLRSSSLWLAGGKTTQLLCVDTVHMCLIGVVRVAPKSELKNSRCLERRDVDKPERCALAFGRPFFSAVAFWRS